MQVFLVLQHSWDMIRAQEAYLKSPFFPVLFSFFVYLGFCLPYMILDMLSWKVDFLTKYKIQPKSQITWAMLRTCIVLTVYNHIVFIFPLTVLNWYWRPVSYPLEAPGILRLILDIIACLLLFDFQYFVWHLIHHKVPWLYKTFHKVHHKYTLTFALATEHSGAWETLSLGFFAAINPVLLNCHPLTEMLFFIVNIWLSVEDHCGYDFPWSPHRLVPFGLFGGAPHHDIHHLKFKSNYAPYFTHWDKLFGTFLQANIKTAILTHF
ncbi:cholesterol 25-hydroxylase-like protein [Amia ocellicauda]|uniref:cholesterol 25-hydroxylase-like protein n=1 Tax=Amia ocellicauda TaxID=2972642 RepID=UPI003463874E